MSLEKWHQEIKYNSMVQGPIQRRLDISIIILNALKFVFKYVSF